MKINRIRTKVLKKLQPYRITFRLYRNSRGSMKDRRRFVAIGARSLGFLGLGKYQDKIKLSKKGKMGSRLILNNIRHLNICNPECFLIM